MEILWSINETADSFHAAGERKFAPCKLRHARRNQNINLEGGAVIETMSCSQSVLKQFAEMSRTKNRIVCSSLAPRRL